MKLYKHKNSIFDLPVNILSVLRQFLGHMTHYPFYNQILYNMRFYWCNFTVLIMIIVLSCSLFTLQAFFNRKVDNVDELIDAQDFNGQTPLHMACEIGLHK